jgi:hypothetical protein
MDNQDEIKNKLRGLGLTIDHLDKMYGKGSVSVVTLTDEQREKENKKREIARLKSLWVQFIHYKQSTELWDKIDFEQIFENSEHLLNVSYSLHETGPYYNGETDNEKTINRNKKVIDKLREIYNERFKEIEPEEHTKFTLPELFALLGKLGLTDSPLYNGLTEYGKGQLIAKLVQVHPDNAKKLKNGTYPTKGPIDKQKIDAFLNKYKKG